MTVTAWVRTKHAVQREGRTYYCLYGRESIIAVELLDEDKNRRAGRDRTRRTQRQRKFEANTGLEPP